MSNGKVYQEERAFRAWGVLTSYAKKIETITYKELGGKLHVHHRTVAQSIFRKALLEA